MLYEGITRDIIGAAMAVLNELKPGRDEKLCFDGPTFDLNGLVPLVQQMES